MATTRQKRGSIRVSNITGTIKAWLQRFAFVLLAGTALTLMILGKADSPVVERLRVTITDAAMPVLEVLTHPIVSVNAVVDTVNDLVYLRSENTRLRAENERLRGWHDAARLLEQENIAFRDLLGFVADPQPVFISARVIGDSGGAFVRSQLLNAGAADGVRNGQAVVNGDGLVGRVVSTGERSSRVLLLTDLNSRIPVAAETSRVRGILAGDNTDRPRLDFLPVDAGLKPGDRIVTTGRGGMLPPGLPVGIVASVEDGVILVEPFIDWGKLEYVRVLDYVLPGMLPTTRAAGRAGPLP